MTIHLTVDDLTIDTGYISDNSRASELNVIKWIN